jgi:lia operon protein LiaG
MLGKTRFSQVVIVTAIVAVAALAVALIIAAASGGVRGLRFGEGGTAVDQSATLALDGIDLVSVSAFTDDVNVVEGTSDSLEVRLHGSVSTSSPDAVPRLTVERTGATAVVRLERAIYVGFFFWRDFTLDVSVPKKYAGRLSVEVSSADVQVLGHGYAGLAVKATSGDVRAQGVTAGDASFSASSGGIRLDGLAVKDLGVNTTSGDIHMEGVSTNSLDVSASSGGIRATGLTGSGRVHTTSGDVSLAFAALPSDLDAECSSGGLTVKVPAAAAFSLDAHCSSGDITCAFPITVTVTPGTHEASHSLVGVVGGGTPGATMKLRTTSGDIRIQKGG